VDRIVVIDHLPEGEIAVGMEAFEQRRDAASADDVVLGCVAGAGGADE